MANTKIPAELSSTPGIIDNSNATAITIDSSENVGIGTVPESWNSAFRALDIGVNGALISQTASGGDELHLISNGYYDGAWKYKESNSANQIILNNGAITFEKAASGTANAALTWEETMRIDSSGNLLVGTTDVDLGYTDGDSGVVLTPDGFIQAARNSAYSILYLNKLNNDGPLIDFHKDGTTVGSIGVDNNNNLTIGGSVASHAGFEFGTNIVLPLSGGTQQDAAVDLGYTSSRFKNLYLSGGVHLGGTGSANKLDDYEEGTWTPIVKLGTTTVTSANSGFYTKIGRIITLQVQCSFSNLNSGTGNLTIEGIPFNSADVNHRNHGSVGYYNVESSFGENGVQARISRNTSYIDFMRSHEISPAQHGHVASNSELYITITYKNE